MLKKILNFMNDEMEWYYDVYYPIDGVVQSGKVIVSKWKVRRQLIVDWYLDVWKKGLSDYSLKRVKG